MKHTWKKILLSFLVGINVFALICITLIAINFHSKESDAQIQTLIHTRTKKMTFDQLSSFFKDLAQKRGAVYAFDILKQVEIGPNIDMHLLGHVVGDELYKQKGIDGMKYCTQDFRNACSHTIVIGAFTKFGENALPMIAQACEKAPGGSGAYTMCFHGLGHGVLAYYGYDYKKAAQICEKTGTAAHNNREASECIGGMVMEMISGGGHDHETWSKQRLVYLHPNNPTSLCDPSTTPENARIMCYTYITPYLWEAAGGGQNPTREQLKVSFHLCDSIKEDSYRQICYGGFGKEFIALATSRDIRQVNAISTSQAKTIHDLCALSPNDEALHGCIEQAVASLFWGGENDPHSSLIFCQQYTGSKYESFCYTQFSQNVQQYITPDKKSSFCTLLPSAYQPTCKSGQPSSQ